MTTHVRWKTFIAVSFGIASAFFGAQSAHAETLNSAADLPANKRIAAYILSRPMIETLYRLGTEQDKQLGLQAGCQSQYNVKAQQLIVLAPVELADDKQVPSKGAWRIRYDLSRCGETKIYNAIFSVNPKTGAVEPHPYFPGTSLASLQLIRDSLPQATANAILRSKTTDCKNVDILDMNVTQAPHTTQDGGKEFKGVWTEQWTLRICEQAVNISLRFIPDANGSGTTYTVLPQ